MPDEHEQQVLFYLPVTKAWLCQFVIVLLLVCKASYRNIIDSMHVLLDTHISLGSIHNLLTDTFDKESMKKRGQERVMRRQAPCWDTIG